MTESRPLPYSSRTRIALAIARAIAAGRGDTDVTPVHIALGLVREGEGAVGRPPSDLRRDLEHLLGPPPGGTQPDEVVRPLTPGEQHVVEQARICSQRAGDDHVGPDHLLLVLLADRESPVAQVLARHWVDA